MTAAGSGSRVRAQRVEGLAVSPTGSSARSGARGTLSSLVRNQLCHQGPPAHLLDFGPSCGRAPAWGTSPALPVASKAGVAGVARSSQMRKQAQRGLALRDHYNQVGFYFFVLFLRFSKLASENLTVRVWGVWFQCRLVSLPGRSCPGLGGLRAPKQPRADPVRSLPPPRGQRCTVPWHPSLSF